MFHVKYGFWNVETLYNSNHDHKNEKKMYKAFTQRI